MPRKKEEVEEVIETVEVVESPVVPEAKESEKEHLLKLYQELLDRKINSISDLEGLIARS